MQACGRGGAAGPRAALWADGLAQCGKRGASAWPSPLHPVKVTNRAASRRTAGATYPHRSRPAQSPTLLPLQLRARTGTLSACLGTLTLRARAANTAPPPARLARRTACAPSPWHTPGPPAEKDIREKPARSQARVALTCLHDPAKNRARPASPAHLRQRLGVRARQLSERQRKARLVQLLRCSKAGTHEQKQAKQGIRRLSSPYQGRARCFKQSLCAEACPKQAQRKPHEAGWLPLPPLWSAPAQIAVPPGRSSAWSCWTRPCTARRTRGGMNGRVEAEVGARLGTRRRRAQTSSVQALSPSSPSRHASVFPPCPPPAACCSSWLLFSILLCPDPSPPAACYWASRWGPLPRGRCSGRHPASGPLGSPLE
jgi:hypothetical protein